MAVWPEELIITRQNYSETPPNRVIRSSMDKGPDKLRRRTSANIRPVSVSLFLDSNQIDILDEFYLDNDSEVFDFPNPRTETTVDARFVSPPQYKANETMWNVSVELEILP